METNCNSITYNINLTRLEGTEPQWRWMRSDGVAVSPIFTTQEAAVHYGKNYPLITDEEWKEHFPIEQNPNNHLTDMKSCG